MKQKQFLRPVEAGFMTFLALLTWFIVVGLVEVGSERRHNILGFFFDPLRHWEFWALAVFIMVGTAIMLVLGTRQSSVPRCPHCGQELPPDKVYLADSTDNPTSELGGGEPQDD